AAAGRERKIRGGRALSLASLEEKSGQEGSSPSGQRPADFAEHAARLTLGEMGEERLRQHEARFAVCDRQPTLLRDALEPKPPVTPVSLHAPANRSLVNVDADVASPRPEPLREVRRHRAGSASDVEYEIVGADQSERLDSIRRLPGSALEEMDGTGLAPQ